MFCIYWFSIKLQNIIINQIHFNYILKKMGAYNRMYFVFTENGLMIFFWGGGAHRQLFVVIIIEANFPPVCFITFFDKRIFLFSKPS